MRRMRTPDRQNPYADLCSRITLAKNVADDGLLGDEIYALASDTQGRIWAATDAGISVCSMLLPGQKQVQNLTRADGLTDEIITALLADPQGAMWIGTHDSGICRYDITSRRCVSGTPNWAFGPVTNLARFGSQEIWAGTETNGLVQIDAVTGRIYSLPAGHGLQTGEMRSLCKDREGLLWAVNDQGQLYSANVRFGQLETPFTNTQAVWMGRHCERAFPAGKWKVQKNFCTKRKRRLVVGIPRGWQHLGRYFRQWPVHCQPDRPGAAAPHGKQRAGQRQHSFHWRQQPTGVAGHAGRRTGRQRPAPGPGPQLPAGSRTRPELRV